jgi:hypothetical protein
MNSIIEERKKQALFASPYCTPKTKDNGRTIQGIICPECGDKSAWGYSAALNSINCNKLNTCGCRTPTAELLGVFPDIEREFPPEKGDKHRPARIYLESRGLRKSLEGLAFEYWPGRRVRHGSGAVMFPVQSPTGKVYNGRLIKESDDGKTHNSGSTTGCYWRHPGREYDPQKTTFVTEGIIDALSLIEAGQQAIAVLASGQDPAKVVLPPLGRLVFAFDNDAAGLAATKKWLAAYPGAGAIMPDKGTDWNDWLRSIDPDKAEEEFQKALPRFELNAKLALADTAREYADLYFTFHNRPPGIFSHNGSTFFSSTSKEVSVERIGRFTFSVISFTRDTSSNPEQPDYLYNLSVRLPGVPKPIQATATNKDLATLRGTREFFLGKCKTTFTGSQAAALAFGDKITSSKAPEVTQFIHTGYSPKTSWYVFHKWAVDETGKVHWADNNGLFKTGHRVWIKPPNHAAEKAITPALTGPGVKEIHRKLTAAFGDNGAAALAWTVAGWFVNQIKAEIGFFPALSTWGDPASSKSSLTVVLNSLQGILGEGLPVSSSASTKKALMRSISRSSGMFTALLENNDRDRSSLDLSILLTAYNRGPLQLSARFTNDNQVREAPFLGSLLFCQNVEQFTDPAERQRVISLFFSHARLTEETKIAYEQLTKIPPQQLARFILLVLQQRCKFEEQWPAEFEKATADLADINHQRIRGNHALVLAFHRLLCQLFNIEYDLSDFLSKTAQNKISSASQTIYTTADLFLEALLELNQDEKTASFLHLDEKEERLFVNLPGAEKHLRNSGIQIFMNNTTMSDLSKHPAFIASKRVFRFPNDQEKDSFGRTKQRRCWVFDATKT